MPSAKFESPEDWLQSTKKRRTTEDHAYQWDVGRLRRVGVAMHHFTHDSEDMERNISTVSGTVISTVVLGALCFRRVPCSLRRRVWAY